MDHGPVGDLCRTRGGSLDGFRIEVPFGKSKEREDDPAGLRGCPNQRLIVVMKACILEEDIACDRPGSHALQNLQRLPECPSVPTGKAKGLPRAVGDHDMYQIWGDLTPSLEAIPYLEQAVCSPGVHSVQQPGESSCQDERQRERAPYKTGRDDGAAPVDAEYGSS